MRGSRANIWPDTMKATLPHYYNTLVDCPQFSQGYFTSCHPFTWLYARLGQPGVGRDVSGNAAHACMHAMQLKYITNHSVTERHCFQIMRYTE